MQFAFSAVTAQAIPPQTTHLEWTLGALSSFSSLLVLLSGVFLFVGACYLLKSGRPASVLAAYLVLLPLPCCISICGSLSGMINSLTVIAATPGLTVTRSNLAGGLAATLMGLLAAILVSAPAYGVLTYGLLSRTMRPPTNSTEHMIPSVTPPAALRDPSLGTMLPATSS